MALGTREQRGHEEHVPEPFRSGGHLHQIACELPVVLRPDRREGLRADDTRRETFHIEPADRRVRPRCKPEAFPIWMPFQQKPSRLQRHKVAEGLIYLLHDVERPSFERMGADRIELEAGQRLDWISGKLPQHCAGVRGVVFDYRKGRFDFSDGELLPDPWTVFGIFKLLPAPADRFRYC